MIIQLKIPFTKAFSRKKLKLSSTSDADSDTASLYSDASLAQSAQAQLSGTRSVPTTPIKSSRSDVMLVNFVIVVVYSPEIKYMYTNDS